MPENLVATKDTLKADVAATVADVRASYFAFLTAGLYLAITVGAVTHEELLGQARVALPLLGVTLPVAGFSFVAPLLFLVLHLNLLFQLRLLAPKVHRLDEAIDRLPVAGVRRIERTLLSSFPFVQVVAGRSEGLLHRMLRLTVWLTVVWAPALVLLEVLVLFLPYHSAQLTTWHRIFVLADLVLVWVLWPGCLWRQDEPPRGYWTWIGLGLLSFLLVLCLLVATQPGGTMERFTLAGVDWKWSQAIIKEDPRGRRMLWPTWRLLEHPEIPVSRNLRLHEADFVPEKPPIAVMENIGELEALRKYSRRRDLRGRDLRYADLTGADLRFVDLRALPSTAPSARLEGALLRFARLQGALLNEARLADANLERAHLERATLESACLRDASLRRADLTDANFRRADLTGADLTGADLTGAHLTGVDLTGADLTDAKNLTQEQLDRACGDRWTKLPPGLRLTACVAGGSASGAMSLR